METHLAQWLQGTPDGEQAEKLHGQMSQIGQELADLVDQWLEMQEESGEG